MPPQMSACLTRANPRIFSRSFNYVELSYFLTYIGKQYSRTCDIYGHRQPDVDEKRISTEHIIQSIGKWLETDEGKSSGGIRGIFERADKEFSFLNGGSETVRLCMGCSEDLLQVSRVLRRGGAK